MPQEYHPLHVFLAQHRERILEWCKERTLKNSENRPSSPALEKGLGIFFDELVGVLKRDERRAEPDTQQVSHELEAANHGREYLRLGYTISEVVHSYGVICQAITGAADELQFHMSSREFRQLNLSLDVAIAEAVTAFEYLQSSMARDNEVERLGFLSHELRGSLHSALMALSVIESGTLGLKSQTGGVLARSLARMEGLIEATISEVRSRHQNEVHLRRFNVSEILREVEENIAPSAELREITLAFEVDGSLEVDADRQLLLSALLNLVQNAVKFSKLATTVHVRAKLHGEKITIEVEDECGGLSSGKTEKLFTPFTQYDKDRSGLGLGLAISRRAAHLNGGELDVEDFPGKGCIFRLVLPQAGGQEEDVPTVPEESTLRK